MLEIPFLFAGALSSWFITRHYYRRSLADVPEWAKPLIKALPPQPPSDEELLRLFQESLQSGKVKPDPFVGHVACPNCNAPSTQFTRKGYFDDKLGRGVVHVECPSCGWHASEEV